MTRRIRVRAHVRKNKKGKSFSVKAHERNIKTKHIKPILKKMKEEKLGYEDIKKRFPNLYEALYEMGMDNDMDFSERIKLDFDIQELSDAEEFFTKIKGKTVGDIEEEYKLKDNKEYESFNDEDDPAFMAMACGEASFAEELEKKDILAKNTSEVMNEFFDGKYTKIFKPVWED